ncbi:MAG: hypothetical protein R3F46_00170 [bacterium]
MAKKTVKQLAMSNHCANRSILDYLDWIRFLNVIDLGKDSTKEIEAQLTGNLQFDTGVSKFFVLPWLQE